MQLRPVTYKLVFLVSLTPTFYWETLSNAELASSGRDTCTLAPVIQLHLRLLISSATRRGCYQSPNVPQHRGAARAIRLQEAKRLGALRSEMHVLRLNFLKD